MAKEDGNEVGTVEGEYQAPKVAEAFEHHKQYIAPKKAKISELTGDCSAPWEHIKKHCHMPRKVMNFLIGLDEEDDDAKQQHMVDALFDGLAHLGLERSRDLVTMAEDGSDLPPGLGDEKDFEASEAELATQKIRPSVEKAEGQPEAVH